MLTLVDLFLKAQQMALFEGLPEKPDKPAKGQPKPQPAQPSLFGEHAPLREVKKVVRRKTGKTFIQTYHVRPDEPQQELFASLHARVEDMSQRLEAANLQHTPEYQTLQEVKGKLAEHIQQAPATTQPAPAPAQDNAPISAKQYKAAETNVARLLHKLGIAEQVMQGEDFYLKIPNEPYMPLVIERHREPSGQKLYLTHYRDYGGEQRPGTLTRSRWSKSRRQRKLPRCLTGFLAGRCSPRSTLRWWPPQTAARSRSRARTASTRS